ncbi:MAG TPA: metallophosphoesterase [Chitinophagaceae bacterium]|nr:metallophosphoesterase [Chitinophagaceae bacterium]
MKNIALIFIPLLLAGFMLPEEKCSTPRPHTTKHDGPYVLYKNNQLFVKYIIDDHGVKKMQADSMPLEKRMEVSLQVATDDPGKMLDVKLKERLENEKAEFPGVDKMFIVSDIEGNFAAFRKLLVAGGVIDSNYNWKFGNGHLVLTGDFVDRGMQVTEVLWLIYSLEEKAKTAGGYVHYILGNHEIMNMSGDLRYLHPKYVEASGLLQEGFTSLYGENSELGRWLRTKNVMEKIGDVLFMHGGVSAAVNRQELSTTRLNKLVRPFYGDSLYNYKNLVLDTLYSDLGPFWYRGYYKASPSSEINTVDSTLMIYRVKKIATGHTVVADTITARFNGKVINTDVHHAGGHSEAVLMEGGKYYRITASGEKKMLIEQ